MGSPTLSLVPPGAQPPQIQPEPLAPAPVTASPIPAPQSQTVPEEQPDAEGLLHGLYGKTVGKVLRGLGVVDNDYTVDPTTGKTVAVPVKSTPGQTSKAILAAGLLGMRGIGPKEGQMTFAQGLLSGLSGGMDASRQLQMEKDQKARLEAQQQFENELKSKESARQDKELQLRTTLDNAQIASFNANRIMKNWEFSRQKELANREDSLTTAQGLVAADKPLKSMFDTLEAQPLEEATTPEEYQKMLQDDAKDINLHNAIPVITGYVNVQTKNPDGSISLHAEPIGNIYKASDMKFTPSTLSDLASAGFKKDDPLYRSVETSIKNGEQVQPAKVAAVYRAIDDRQNWAEKQSVIARNNAEATRARLGTRSDAVAAELASLKLADYKEKKLGEDLFSAVGDPDGIEVGEGKNKHTIVIPTTGTGHYNFSQLKDPAQRSALRNYIFAATKVASQDYSSTANAATKAGNSPDRDPATLDAFKTLSTLNNMYHDLTGGNVADVPSNVDPRVASFVDQVKTKKITDPTAIQNALTSAGYPPEAQTEVWKSLGLEPPKPHSILNPMGKAVVGGVKKAAELYNETGLPLP